MTINAKQDKKIKTRQLNKKDSPRTKKIDGALAKRPKSWNFQDFDNLTGEPNDTLEICGGTPTPLEKFGLFLSLFIQHYNTSWDDLIESSKLSREEVDTLRLGSGNLDFVLDKLKHLSYYFNIDEDLLGEKLAAYLLSEI